MGRLIAGLDGSMLQTGSDGAGATEAVVYIAETIPVGGFFGLDPPQASPGRADAAAPAPSAASAGGAASAAMLGEPAPADYGAEPDPATAAAAAMLGEPAPAESWAGFVPRHTQAGWHREQAGPHGPRPRRDCPLLHALVQRFAQAPP